MIATGTAATQDAHIPFDGQRIFISDDILRLEQLPRTLAVVGAGVIGWSTPASSPRWACG